MTGGREKGARSTGTGEHDSWPAGGRPNYLLNSSIAAHRPPDSFDIQARVNRGARTRALR